MIDKILKISVDDFGVIALENLSKGITIRFRAHGRSMYPAVHNGDIITIAPLDHHDIKMGDIIFYRTSTTNALIAHRIIKIKPRESTKAIYTRGDASGGELEQVDQKNILGRATLIERDGKITRIDKPIPRLKGKLWAISKTIRFRYQLIRKH